MTGELAATMEGGNGFEGSAFLQKPFRVADVLNLLRESLAVVPTVEVLSFLSVENTHAVVMGHEGFWLGSGSGMGGALLWFGWIDDVEFAVVIDRGVSAERSRRCGRGRRRGAGRCGFWRRVQRDWRGRD